MNASEAFSLLGCDPLQSSSQEIKQAFRSLVKIWAPDLASDPEGQHQRTKRMVDLTLAKTAALEYLASGVLDEETARQQYDQLARAFTLELLQKKRLRWQVCPLEDHEDVPVVSGPGAPLKTPKSIGELLDRLAGAREVAGVISFHHGPKESWVVLEDLSGGYKSVVFG